MRIFILSISVFLFSNFVLAEEDFEEPVIEYVKMGPKFIVNLDKPKNFLAVTVQLMIEGEKNIEKINTHMPALRHELIMLYTGRSIDELQTMSDREDLRKESKQAIIKALDEYSSSLGLRDLYFTEFLVN